MTGLTREETPIGKQHDRAAFDCGDADRNLYLRKFAWRRKMLRRGSCQRPARILGVYTLSPASPEYARSPTLAKKPVHKFVAAPKTQVGRCGTILSVGFRTSYAMTPIMHIEKNDENRY